MRSQVGRGNDRTGLCESQLPNGVVRSSRASDSPAGMESLPYSPAALPHNREATAVLAEAWPSPAADRWVRFCRDTLHLAMCQPLYVCGGCSAWETFFRQHPAMETFTTMTRQQFVELIRPCLEGKREGLEHPSSLVTRTSSRCPDDGWAFF